MKALHMNLRSLLIHYVFVTYVIPLTVNEHKEDGTNCFDLTLRFGNLARKFSKRIDQWCCGIVWKWNFVCSTRLNWDHEFIFEVYNTVCGSRYVDKLNLGCCYVVCLWIVTTLIWDTLLDWDNNTLIWTNRYFE